MADRKGLTIYTLHRSHTYVQDIQFNGRQKRVNYLHTTQKSYIRTGQTIQWPTEKSQLSTHYTEYIHTCRTGNSMADRKESTMYTLHRSHTYVLDRQFNGRQERVNYLHTTQKSYIRAGQIIQWPTKKSQLSTQYTEVIHTCWTDNSIADRKELTIYTLHRSHTYVLDRQFNGRQKRVNYLHTTQKSYIRAGQTIQWPTEKS